MNWWQGFKFEIPVWDEADRVKWDLFISFLNIVNVQIEPHFQNFLGYLSDR